MIAAIRTACYKRAGDGGAREKKKMTVFHACSKISLVLLPFFSLFSLALAGWHRPPAALLTSPIQLMPKRDRDNSDTPLESQALDSIDHRSKRITGLILSRRRLVETELFRYVTLLDMSMSCRRATRGGRLTNCVYFES